MLDIPSVAAAVHPRQLIQVYWIGVNHITDVSMELIAQVVLSCKMGEPRDDSTRRLRG